ncbi:hypothetical protein BP6252_09574 [Coleophoma cylindrospora]|uniref:Heterokaryon incompatibility domain-containing protein n=1 Tax=Coleophoma cylindrospora TaxID=1849047 RepID=A0A3D8R2K3_9HELO|nr:hypothetical protein BP6252_09574 [Coleophoma cylindrospora]
MTTLVYTPLSFDDLHIRLLTLHPGEYNDRIRISLHKVRLLSAIGQRDESVQSQVQSPLQANNYIPSYEALSYAWGPSENARTITKTSASSDALISVTENLDTALRHLRYTKAGRLLWIDAICIDQENVAERSCQVSFMGTIYALATRVAVWLGPKDGDSSYAMDLVESLGQKLAVD